ncbi:hypothetical protein [Moraxella sp.]|uniref:hypothetical protein n=1 Tax=Moraxella sp. TaxID=479 RepID=UPI0026DB5C87|nr:hypothetical protein [Moraxella sp.]MDO4895408.1 hypothetical protein [Moraxella sp.]
MLGFFATELVFACQFYLLVMLFHDKKIHWWRLLHTAVGFLPSIFLLWHYPEKQVVNVMAMHLAMVLIISLVVSQSSRPQYEQLLRSHIFRDKFKIKKF